MRERQKKGRKKRKMGGILKSSVFSFFSHPERQKDRRKERKKDKKMGGKLEVLRFSVYYIPREIKKDRRKERKRQKQEIYWKSSGFQIIPSRVS